MRLHPHRPPEFVEEGSGCLCSFGASRHTTRTGLISTVASGDASRSFHDVEFLATSSRQVEEPGASGSSGERKVHKEAP